MINTWVVGCWSLLQGCWKSLSGCRQTAVELEKDSGSPRRHQPWEKRVKARGQGRAVVWERTWAEGRVSYSSVFASVGRGSEALRNRACWGTGEGEALGEPALYQGFYSRSLYLPRSPYSRALSFKRKAISKYYSWREGCGEKIF